MQPHDSGVCASSSVKGCSSVQLGGECTIMLCYCLVLYNHACNYVGLMVYSKDEIERATNNFHSSNRIGVGAFGEVYKGTLRHTQVAIKTVKVQYYA